MQGGGAQFPGAHVSRTQEEGCGGFETIPYCVQLCCQEITDVRCPGGYECDWACEAPAHCSRQPCPLKCLTALRQVSAYMHPRDSGRESQRPQGETAESPAWASKRAYVQEAQTQMHVRTVQGRAITAKRTSVCWRPATGLDGGDQGWGHPHRHRRLCGCGERLLRADPAGPATLVTLETADQRAPDDSPHGKNGLGAQFTIHH